MAVTSDWISSVWIYVKWHLVKQHSCISVNNISIVHYSNWIKTNVLFHLYKNAVMFWLTVLIDSFELCDAVFILMFSFKENTWNKWPSKVLSIKVINTHRSVVHFYAVSYTRSPNTQVYMVMWLTSTNPRHCIIMKQIPFASDRFRLPLRIVHKFDCILHHLAAMIRYWTFCRLWLQMFEAESEWHQEKQQSFRKFVQQSDLNVRSYKAPLEVCDLIKKVNIPWFVCYRSIIPSLP